ncbi:MAG: RHS repeat-associated core domain-containing protein [Bacteroidales bacterium]|nr:RHS repeat-associated core domain-containing protein [Bacteroidales bacterium]
MSQTSTNITSKYCQETRYNYVGNSGFWGSDCFFLCSPLLCYRFVSTTLTAQIPTETLSQTHRVCFIRKERDSETGFSYFGARYYDSDILTGWLSVDPMADKYPGLSPYAYCAWNPVKLVDPDGEEIWIVGDDGNRYRYNKGKVYYENGKEYIGNDLFVSEVKNSLDRNRKHDYSKSTIDYFSGKSKENENITIVRTTGETILESVSYDSETKQRVATISFNPNLGLTDGKGNILTPATALQHELGHIANAQYVDKDWGNLSQRRGIKNDTWKDKEEEYNIKTHE